MSPWFVHRNGVALVATLTLLDRVHCLTSDHTITGAPTSSAQGLAPGQDAPITSLQSFNQAVAGHLVATVVQHVAVIDEAIWDSPKRAQRPKAGPSVAVSMNQGPHVH